MPRCKGHTIPETRISQLPRLPARRPAWQLSVQSPDTGTIARPIGRWTKLIPRHTRRRPCQIPPSYRLFHTPPLVDIMMEEAAPIPTDSPYPLCLPFKLLWSRPR